MNRAHTINNFEATFNPAYNIACHTKPHQHRIATTQTAELIEATIRHNNKQSMIFAAIPFIFILGYIAWNLAPSWTKAKRRDTVLGKPYFEIIGNIDNTDPSLLDRIRHCLDQLSHHTKQVNRDGPGLWIRMFFSYIIVILHRSLMAGRLSHDEKDKILTSDGTLADPVPRQKMEGLLHQINFAKWAYPFDPNYINLNGCLRQEGYVLLEHSTATAPGRVAHYTAINSKEKILLVVPRGSCGLSDIVTDVVGNLVSQTLAHPTDPRLQEIYSHEGCLMAANRLVTDITPLVERLVTKDGYKLHIVGHSLGAAVACVAGTILRSQLPVLDDPTRLHIWAYASPPCLNVEASEAMEPFLSSMVWNDDIIPTLSIPNYVFTCKMVAHMDQREREHHRFLYIGKALVTSLSTVLGWKQGAISEARQAEMIDYALEYTRSLHAERLAKNDVIDLCVPGKVVFLWERRHWNQATGEINGVTAPGNKLIHLSIVIPTKHSLKDHFLDSYEKGAKQLLRQLGHRKEHRGSVFLWETLNGANMESC